LIEAEGLTKTFGTFPAVRGISLQVERGRILALLGPNGAGKTTTVRMLTSILRPTAGRAAIAGFDTVRDAQEVRRRVGLLTELPGLYGRMSALDYLDFFGQLQGVGRGERSRRSEQLLRRFGIWEQRDRAIGAYSKGMRQKMALARALIHQPEVIILDEPTSAMDPASAKQVRDQILELRAEGRTVVVCTHNLAEAETLADQVAIVKAGRIVAEGTTAELRRRLLGSPSYELWLDGDATSARYQIADLVQVEWTDGDRLTYRVAAPERTNPAVLRRLVAADLPVISLSEVPRNLESIYLRIVEGDGPPVPEAVAVGV
jgi:ABC-2 type transport system ATP-binding protein